MIEYIGAAHIHSLFSDGTGEIPEIAEYADESDLMGGDPSTLLPATASGGCVAAGRDAFTISGPDYFDRMISADCETGE